MIYLDASVVLAQLLVDGRVPPASLWDETLVSSRLLQYEAWVVLNARKLGGSHGDSLRALLCRIAFIELDRRILARVLEPFPAPVRTLDALHLATCLWLGEQGQTIELASYDTTLVKAAKRMKQRLLAL